jgi:hypothetical protein
VELESQGKQELLVPTENKEELANKVTLDLLGNRDHQVILTYEINNAKCRISMNKISMKIPDVGTYVDEDTECWNIHRCKSLM